MKHLHTAALSAALCAAAFLPVLGDTLIISDSPDIVRDAEIREALRQNGTWTPENIQAHPYLFLQDQIRNCDRLKAKIEAQKITLTRMGKQAARTVEESDGMIARYTKFLEQAKPAYKAVAAEDKWPVTLNGYEMDEEELTDRIADALERIELAKKDKATNEAIGKKVEIRQGVLKTKTRELQSLRLKLVQQSEQVKMNEALAELGDLASVLGTIKDMMLDIDEDPTKLSLDDLTAEDPNAKKKKVVRAFLDD